MPTTPAISSDALKEVTRLGNALIEAENKVSEAEQALKDAKEQARILREEDIPEYLKELGLTAIKLDSGETVSYKPDVRLEWDDEQKGRALEWLEGENNGEFAGLIKTTVTTNFGKGELEKAKELLAKIEEIFGYAPVLKRDVNWQTMCAFLREQIESGKAIPLDQWGAVAINKATVKGPPKPRKKIGAAA